MPANEYFIPSAGQAKDLVLPSGGKAKIIPLQMEDVIELDLLDSMDMFGSIVQDKHIDRVKKPQDRKPKKPTKAQQNQSDTKMMLDLFKDGAKWAMLKSAMDRVVAKAVQMPPVVLAYNEQIEIVDGQEKRTWVPFGPDDERTGGVIYTDSIGLEDKMFIFGNCIPGGKGLRQFPDGSGENLGDLDDLAEDAGEA